MGYDTHFDGEINIDPPLNEEKVAWLQSFLNNCHEEDNMPSTWCDLVVSEEGDCIGWSGSEKTYSLPNWFAYLIKNYFRPNGHVLNGTIDARGEDADDMWQIGIINNKVTTQSMVALPVGDINDDFDDGSE